MVCTCSSKGTGCPGVCARAACACSANSACCRTAASLGSCAKRRASTACKGLHTLSNMQKHTLLMSCTHTTAWYSHGHHNLSVKTRSPLLTMQRCDLVSLCCRLWYKYMSACGSSPQPSQSAFQWQALPEPAHCSCPCDLCWLKKLLACKLDLDPCTQCA